MIIKSNQVFYILMIVGAILFGRGLHLASLPAFWDANPTSARLNAAAYIIAGICVFIVAKFLKPTRESAKHDSEVA